MTNTRQNIEDHFVHFEVCLENNDVEGMQTVLARLSNYYSEFSIEEREKYHEFELMLDTGNFSYDDYDDDYDDDGQPSWEQEWEDFGEVYGESEYL
jgi:hypothetical protein